jgi:hypothetical protein
MKGKKAGFSVNFGKCSCSWIRIRISNTNPDPGQPKQCGSGLPQHCLHVSSTYNFPHQPLPQVFSFLIILVPVTFFLSSSCPKCDILNFHCFRRPAGLRPASSAVRCSPARQSCAATSCTRMRAARTSRSFCRWDTRRCDHPCSRHQLFTGPRQQQMTSYHLGRRRTNALLTWLNPRRWDAAIQLLMTAAFPSCQPVDAAPPAQNTP